MPELFPGFTVHDLETRGARIHARAGGSGPPVLLLHGYPQTHAIWHRVAGPLAARFSVVAADLRGYGDSGKPPSAPDHAPYSKRAMAQDLVEAMGLLGFESFHVVGHDRGARVGHRLSVDHAARARSLTVLDIAPTLAMYEQTDMDFARAYYHWFFLIQPEPLPERLIGADPGFFLREKLRGWSQGRWPFEAAAFAEYLRCFEDPATIHASCEDYRAAATIDLEHDRADRDAGRRVRCPVLASWGERGTVHRCFRPLEEWRRVADGDVGGGPLPSGHYLPEEVPELLLRELLPFLERAETAPRA
ncbi:alpha/beta fold hydrolase [Anaeromyxobacter sp. Fw109-5]|uniref:alpha/beta fold hydrolase n=1 Tax=Anaeromyxobacter sp. (strain Fw109-5) TaxID=404589 RepID=UPI000158A463|nr:alpha/beta hydrolase [Anaeromyxobacter sp. Fw109-5]ABS24696.1 alpha/beta hydrolase fold [Anaeromyxobacter sp. Fw109-5]